MKTVAILGSKGGTGKTSLSHCLAYGAHLHNQPSVMVHTDQRDPLKSTRPYPSIDASSNFSQASSAIKSHADQEGLLVIDGAGNRRHQDTWITQSVDLVLLPVTNSPEDVRCARSDLTRLADPRVYVVVNRWPSNSLVRAVMQRYISALPTTRLVGRLPDVGAVRTLLEDVPWRTPPTKVNNLARHFYRLVQRAITRHQTYPLPERRDTGDDYDSASLQTL